MDQPKSAAHMSTLKTFLDQQKITAKHVAVTSNRLEAFKEGDDALRSRRKAKRLNEADKKYAELNIAKPNSGRGVSELAVNTALAGKPITRKNRSKILKAVNTILTHKKQAAVEMKALFEGAEMRKGKVEEKKEESAKK
jgi:hypothetical protein